MKSSNILLFVAGCLAVAPANAIVTTAVFNQLLDSGQVWLDLEGGALVTPGSSDGDLSIAFYEGESGGIFGGEHGRVSVGGCFLDRSEPDG